MKVSIKMFQDLYKISMTPLDELDKSIELVKCYTGMTDFEIDKLHPKKFNRICKQITFHFTKFNEKLHNDKPKSIIKTNGSWYSLHYDIEQLPINAGRYVEIATFKEDIIGNLHLMMASMAVPAKLTLRGFREDKTKVFNHNKIANDFLHADFLIAYHSAVFFWAVFKQSMKSSQTYLVEQAKDKKGMEESLQNFLKISDGLIMPKWLANMKELV